MFRVSSDDYAKINLISKFCPAMPMVLLILFCKVIVFFLDDWVNDINDVSNFKEIV